MSRWWCWAPGWPVSAPRSRSPPRRVTIIDQAPNCLLRASLRNEGKIHLGLVYANDPSARTAHLMLEAALRFDRVVEELVGAPVDWAGLRSSAFRYAVLPGSLRTLRELQDAYARLQTRHDQLTRDESLTYLGTRPSALWWPLREPAAREWLGSGVSTGVVATAELALDLARFCQLLRAVLESAEGVEHRWCHRVDDAERTAGGYRLRGRTATGEPWSMRAAIVVNCLWEDRMRLDAQLGFLPRRPWVHRLITGSWAAFPRRSGTFPPSPSSWGRLATSSPGPPAAPTCPGTRPACRGGPRS